jgi:hypothetical protein
MADDQTSGAGQSAGNKRSSFIRVFVRSLGVTFPAVLSLAAAFYAFVSLPQVHDLFFDVRPNPLQGVAYWFEFYLLVILVWAAPLAFTARLLMLQSYEAIGVDTEKRYKWLVLGLPNLYLFLTSVAIFLGLLSAVNNLPSPTQLPRCLKADPAQPVLGVCAEIPLGQYLHTHLAILLIASLVAIALLFFRNVLAQNYYRRIERREKTKSEFYRGFLLAFERLTHRQNGEITDQSTYLVSLKPEWMSESIWITSQKAKVFMINYLLIFMAIFAITLIVHFVSYFDAAGALLSKLNFLAYGPLADFTEPLAVRRASFIPVMLGAWLPFVALLALLSNRFQFPIIASLVLAAALLTVVIGDGHDPRLRITPANAPAMTMEQAVNAWKTANGCGGTASGAAGTNGAPGTPGTAGAPGTAQPACPRPIIAAGEGGGSRAAYLMASTLAHLEDLSLHFNPKVPKRRFSQQLFGISPVSGSAVGAALFLGALRVHESASPARLKEGVYAQKLFFLNVVNAGKDYLGDCVTYKDSLEAILSNDFVSPTLAAFLARDLTTFSRFPYVMDRAGVLESSWESAFAGVYGQNGFNPMQAPLRTFQAGAKAPELASATSLSKMEPGLSCGTSVPPSTWTPLLFANSTSGETGRRVVVSPLDWKDHARPEKNVFSDAYDFDELVCSDQPSRTFLDRVAAFLPYKFSPVSKAECDANSKMTGVDVRLSTAAGLSSRAPFITPHATVRDQKGRAIDNLVDGGYFDNSGAVSAYELASAIKAVDPTLDPFVLQVTSEPGWFADSENCEEDHKPYNARRRLGLPVPGDPQLPYQSDMKFLGAVGDALTVNSTRVARGFETMVQMPERMEQLNGKDVKGSFAEVYVCPQQQQNGLAALTGLFSGTGAKKPAAPMSMRSITLQRRQAKEAMEKAARERIKSWKQLSLSWWLSPPLQAYLDGQVYAPHNVEAFRGVMALLRVAELGAAPQPQ